MTVVAASQLPTGKDASDMIDQINSMTAMFQTHIVALTKISDDVRANDAGESSKANADGSGSIRKFANEFEQKQVAIAADIEAFKVRISA